MIDISKWAFENKKLIYFLIAVLMAGGAYSCYEMSKLEDPEITVKLAMVVTTYPGASAHQVELEVTDVLEKSIRSMGNIYNVESYSYNDLSLIQVELKTTVKETDVEQCWDMLRRKVGNAQAELPQDTNPSVVKDDFGNVYGMFFALTGDGLSDRELSDYSELIKRELSELDGVERVDLYGKRPECINISLLQDRMANLGVKPAEVLATLPVGVSVFSTCLVEIKPGDTVFRGDFAGRWQLVDLSVGQSHTEQAEGFEISIQLFSLSPIRL